MDSACAARPEWLRDVQQTRPPRELADVLSTFHVRFQVCVCQHLARTINTCLAGSTFVLTLVCVVLVVCRKSSRVGLPRPSLSGTGVPWVSCLDPPVCLRVQDDPEAKSQPVIVLVGVLRYCDGRVPVRGLGKRVCVQLRILTFQGSTGSAVQALSRTHSQSSRPSHSYHSYHL